MPFYEKGDIRIRYEEARSRFPILVTPGGGLNSRIDNPWGAFAADPLGVMDQSGKIVTFR